MRRAIACSRESSVAMQALSASGRATGNHNRRAAGYQRAATSSSDLLGRVGEFVKAENEAAKVEHGIALSLAAVLAGDGIFTSVCQFSGLDEPRLAQDAEVLGDIILRDPKALGEIVHREGVVQEGPDNAQAAT